MIDANRPTILDVAALAAQRPGIELPSRRWSAVLSYLYGLPLPDEQVSEVAAATLRSTEAIITHARQTLGRRRFRQFWARIGRRGRKSSTAALIAVFEAIFGGHGAHIMPGEQGLAAVISKDLAGATVVARFVRLYLDALGFTYTTTKIGAVSIIEIDGCPIAVATLAAASEAPRGFAIPVLIVDEFAHLPSGEEYADTDRSILTGAEPAMAQFPDALLVGLSTGRGRDGVHYDRVERGLGADDEHEILSVTGASWEWSADITRERALAIADGDPDVMLTEFEGGVSENEALWMPQADALAMFEPRGPGWFEAWIWSAPFMLIDAAESADTFAYGIGFWGTPNQQRRFKRKPVEGNSGLSADLFVGYELDDSGNQIALPVADRPMLYLFEVGGFDGAEVRELGMDRVVQVLAGLAKRNHVHQVIGDDRAGPYLEALFAQHRVPFSWVSYSGKKHDAVLLCRAWARDRQLTVADHAEMKKQCLRYRRFTRGATYTYGKPGVRDDYVCLLVTLAVSVLRQGEEQSRSVPRIQGAPTPRILSSRSVVTGR